MRPTKKNTKPRGSYAKKYRPTKAEKRLQAIIEAARTPFERLCLLKWTFSTRERAERSARRGQRPVRCRWCGNWHLKYRGGRP